MKKIALLIPTLLFLSFTYSYVKGQGTIVSNDTIVINQPHLVIQAIFKQNNTAEMTVVQAGSFKMETYPDQEASRVFNYLYHLPLQQEELDKLLELANKRGLAIQENQTQ